MAVGPGGKGAVVAPMSAERNVNVDPESRTGKGARGGTRNRCGAPVEPTTPRSQQRSTSTGARSLRKAPSGPDRKEPANESRKHPERSRERTRKESRERTRKESRERTRKGAEREPGKRAGRGGGRRRGHGGHHAGPTVPARRAQSRRPAASEAVSARNTVGPRPTSGRPRASSASSQPPSGPTRIVE